MSDLREVIFDDIDDERHRQQQEHTDGPHHIVYWLALLSEEVGELAHAVLDGQKVETEEDGDLVLEAIRTELVQIAALAVAALEDLDGRFPEVRYPA